MTADPAPTHRVLDAPGVACASLTPLVASAMRELPPGALLEVRTGACDPADLSLPLPANVPAGALLDVQITTAALVADGGEAHLAVVVGEEIAFERRIALPSAPLYVMERVVLASAHSAGTPVVVLVHNHGANVYTIHGLAFLP